MFMQAHFLVSNLALKINNKKGQKDIQFSLVLLQVSHTHIDLFDWFTEHTDVVSYEWAFTAY